MEVTALQNEIEELLACPIRCNIGDPLEAIGDHLEAHWHLVAASFEVDRELRFVDPEGLDREDDPTVLRAMKHNVCTWIERARAKFWDQTRIFRVKLVTLQEHLKHFTLGSIDEGEFIRRTAGGAPARFREGIRPEHLRFIMLQLMEVRFEDLLGTRNKRFAVRCLGHVGAAGGQLTKFLAFEFDASGDRAHAYPVTPVEAASIGIVLRSEGPEEFLVSRS